MRLVKLKLREPNPFWMMGSINLTQSDKESPYLDVDKLTENQAQVINLSSRNKHVFILDSEGNTLTQGLQEANVISGDFVCTEDIEEEEDLIPEIASVTIPMEINEEEKVEEEEEEISKDVYEDAKILLSKNGNTAKAMIKALPDNASSLQLLHACHELELDGKKRPSILSELENKMMES